MPIINVMAISVDGRIASHPAETDAEREALGFTDPADRAHLLALVASADAVIVGSASLLASGGAAFPGLNAQGRPLIWAVWSNQGLPPDAAFYTQAGVPRWLVSRTPLQLPPHQGTIRNLVYGAASAAKATADALTVAGAQRILLFGGASVNQAFYAAGLVDSLIVTICPIVLGAAQALPLVQPPLPAAVRLRLVSSQLQGNLVFLTYDLNRS